jgi:RNA polymerase primary sigma factor
MSDVSKVERVVEVLAADFQRQGSKLLQSQLERAVLKKNLSPDQIVEVIVRLRQQRITPEEDDDTAEPVGVPASAKDGGNGRRSIDYLLRGGGYGQLLSRQEERELARCMRLAAQAKVFLDEQEGSDTNAYAAMVERGAKARERLIRSNLGLVWSVVNKYGRGTSLEPEDLFQEGVCGLMVATERFDGELGIKFSTYATWWIRQSFTRAIHNQDRLIRVPVHMLESLIKFRRVFRNFSQESGDKPVSLRDVAQFLNWPLEKAAFVQQLSSMSCVSLDQPLKDDSKTKIADVLYSTAPSACDIAVDHQRQERIQEVLIELTSKQSEVLERRFGIGNGEEETLEQIGDDFSLTRERIRQIEETAIKRFKKKASQKNLRDVW